jgi:Predicted nucleic acid-binding protein, contains PIN domain
LILYLDTSALVKLYVQESASAMVKRLLAACEAVATSAVAYPETRAAFARRLGEARTTAARHRTRLERFNQDWPHYAQVETSPGLIRHAGDVAEVYGLRGFDSIHLASALWLHESTQMPLLFTAFDARLNDAARAAGLETAT